MNILTVVGARPQFIKSAPVSKALRVAGHTEYVVHTGQHYDYGMSKIFFEELSIAEPAINLNIGSGSHGQQTGRMLIAIEAVIQAQNPDCVLVYGDTNSTLAGALTATKLHIPLAHVESGLRSFNRLMPEEYNRVLTDHASDLLFCPTQSSVENLLHEGILDRVYFVGDTMYDAVLQFTEIANQRSAIMQRLELETKGFLLATLHRPYNTDNPEALKGILTSLQEINEPIIFPVHPRTHQRMREYDLLDNFLVPNSSIRLIDPVGYLDMLTLEKNARLILTDSGGIQKEAYFYAVPCITLRPETEWIETVKAGWNVVVGSDKKLLKDVITSNKWPTTKPEPVFGNGKASQQITRHLEKDIPQLNRTQV
jgi:UDP-GlcNAc3NAcA epimerase